MTVVAGGHAGADPDARDLADEQGHDHGPADVAESGMGDGARHEGCDRREIAFRVVGQRLAGRRIDGMGAGRDEQRVTVRRGLRHDHALDHAGVEREPRVGEVDVAGEDLPVDVVELAHVGVPEERGLVRGPVRLLGVQAERLPVVAAGGELLGSLSKSDLLLALVERRKKPVE